VSGQSLKFLASAPRGFADLLVRELGACGAAQLRERSSGVAFTGTLESAYRACLWSRVANRVYLELAHFEARDADEFHAAVRRIDWAAHLGLRWRAISPGGTPRLLTLTSGR
jgi:23S rRNA (guanine2445-N2)-methyltransferase / 23S rRNA (guanine2069-N7)-methyltransferase